MTHRRWIDWAIVLGLVAGNFVVIVPYLRTDLTAQVWNNDYIHIGLARLYRSQPWTWNAQWYCGFPFSNAYLPVFPLLVAVTPASPGHSFHVVTGLAYALAPATLYLMMLVLLGGRFPALLAAMAYSIFPAPIYLLHDWASLSRGFFGAPWPFVTMVVYAEAPHLLALALIPLAVAAAWRSRWRLASILAAIVFLTNWVGAVAMLMALAAVAIAQWRTAGVRRAAALLFGIAGAAYGLVAFLITPGYFRTIVSLGRVLKYADQVPAPWTAASALVLLPCAGVLALAFWRRVPPVPAFFLAWLALTAAPVLAFALLRNHLLPLPWRYGLEFNMALIAVAAALVRPRASSPVPQSGTGPAWPGTRLGRAGRYATAVAALVLCVAAAGGFLRHAWQLQPRSVDPATLPAFRIASWLDHNAGGARVCTVGELNSSLNVWTNTPQVVGGTAQGFSNPLVVAAHKELAQGCDSGNESLWLRALNARYVVVHDAASREYFHWYVNPEKFATLPLAWSSGDGDDIYRLPDEEVREAAVVDLKALDRLPPLTSTADTRFLPAYVEWAHGSKPASIRWLRPDAAEIDAELGPDEAVLVKTNYDPGWKAGMVRARPDPIGFLLLTAPAGRQVIRLRYGVAWDTWLGRAITLITAVLLLLARLLPARPERDGPGRVAGWARRPGMMTIALVALVPAAVAYAVLPGTPARDAVAEATMRRVRPPIIGAGGIIDRETGAPPPLSRAHAVSIYGIDFGGASDRVMVLVAGREAAVLQRDPNYMAIRIPDGTPGKAEIAVEVNGCRGNTFEVEIRD